MHTTKIRSIFLPALLAAVCLTLPAWAAETKPAVKPAGWEKDMQAFEAADQKNPPPQGGVLFIGSSTVRLWKTLAQDFPDHDVINRGFGGSQIIDSVKYADRIVIPYKPRLIVFFAGGNDINAGKSPEQISGDFKAFVEKVRAALPEVKIDYMASTPNPKRITQMEKQRQLNQLIKEYLATIKNSDYIDTFTPYLGTDGQPREDLFGPDHLHNNAAGYKLRADIVRPFLKGFERPEKK